MAAVADRPAAARTSEGHLPPWPTAYVLVPQRLLRTQAHAPQAIGLYALIGRLYLILHEAIALSPADVQRYDPTLHPRAVARIFNQLLAGGWLLADRQRGRKTRYTPAWGFVGHTPRPWDLGARGLGRPPHVHALRLDEQLLDTAIGRLEPHATQPADVARYLTTPALSLADVGGYALALLGRGVSTPALARLDLIRHGRACAIPPQPQLLARISQWALDPSAMDAPQLTAQGLHALGMAGYPADDSAQNALHIMVYLPPARCPTPPPNPSANPTTFSTCAEAAFRASPSGETEFPAAALMQLPNHTEKNGDPPNPPSHDVGGGSAKHFLWVDSPESIESTSAHAAPHANTTCGAAPYPISDTARALQALQVHPRRIREFADLPIAVVEAAIAAAESRSDLRDRAGWVVTQLRSYRDHGWLPRPAAPRADSPEDLRRYFGPLAAEQDARWAAAEAAEAARADVGGAAADLAADLAAAAADPAAVWERALNQLRNRLTRNEITTWLRPLQLQAIADGVAVLVAPSVPLRLQLETRYRTAVQEHLSDLLGVPVTLRVVEAMPLAGPGDALAPCPAWAAPEHWAALPRMLRAALLGATLVQGVLQPASPHVQRVLDRYAPELAALQAEAARLAGVVEGGPSAAPAAPP